MFSRLAIMASNDIKLKASRSLKAGKPVKATHGRSNSACLHLEDLEPRGVALKSATNSRRHSPEPSSLKQRSSSLFTVNDKDDLSVKANIKAANELKDEEKMNNNSGLEQARNVSEAGATAPILGLEHQFTSILNPALEPGM